MVIVYTLKHWLNGTFIISHIHSQYLTGAFAKITIHLLAKNIFQSDHIMRLLFKKVLCTVLEFILMNMLINAKSNYHGNYLQMGESLTKRKVIFFEDQAANGPV